MMLRAVDSYERRLGTLQRCFIIEMKLQMFTAFAADLEHTLQIVAKQLMLLQHSNPCLFKPRNSPAFKSIE
jgi:hypothetical protein